LTHLTQNIFHLKDALHHNEFLCINDVQGVSSVVDIAVGDNSLGFYDQQRSYKHGSYSQTLSC